MERNKAYLQDIVQAAQRIAEKIAGRSLQDFLEDEDFQDIVMRQITIMGEAARVVSDSIKERYPEVPWHAISGMRNRLVHEYRDIDFEEVWKTATCDVPALLVQVETILSRL